MATAIFGAFLSLGSVLEGINTALCVIEGYGA